MSTSQVIYWPVVEEVVFLYTTISIEVISIVLIREVDSTWSQMYFIYKALANPETCYQKIENVALTLVIVSKKLGQFFLAYTIVVHIDLPIKQVL